MPSLWFVGVFSAWLCIHQRFYTCLITRSADHNQASGLGSPFGPQALGRTHPLLRRDRFQEVLVTSTPSVIEIIRGHPWVWMTRSPDRCFQTNLISHFSAFLCPSVLFLHVVFLLDLSPLTFFLTLSTIFQLLPKINCLNCLKKNVTTILGCCYICQAQWHGSPSSDIKKTQKTKKIFNTQKWIWAVTNNQKSPEMQTLIKLCVC